MPEDRAPTPIENAQYRLTALRRKRRLRAEVLSRPDTRPDTEVPSWVYGTDPPYEAWWASVVPAVRAEAVQVLRSELRPDTLERLRAARDEHNPHDFIHSADLGHHGFGSVVRNLLRDAGVTDDLLPNVRYGDERLRSNWDDFYVQALEEAVTQS